MARSRDSSISSRAGAIFKRSVTAPEQSGRVVQQIEFEASVWDGFSPRKKSRRATSKTCR